jgi:hypothetical protein
MISITGEKVGEAHVVAAVDSALSFASVEAKGFLVTARLEDPPYYCVAIELEHSVDDARLQILRDACDRGLRKVNIEYDTKRGSQRLAALRLLLTSPGVFEQLRVQRVREGAPEAHVKIPHLWRDAHVLEQLGITAEVSDS